MAKARHILIPKTANELWFDALVRHQVYLMRVSGSVRNDINDLLNATEKDMVDRIHAVLHGEAKLSPARLRKAESLIEAGKQALERGDPAVARAFWMKLFPTPPDVVSGDVYQRAFENALNTRYQFTWLKWFWQIVVCT